MSSEMSFIKDEIYFVKNTTALGSFVLKPNAHVVFRGFEDQGTRCVLTFKINENIDGRHIVSIDYFRKNFDPFHRSPKT